MPKNGSGKYYIRERRYTHINQHVIMTISKFVNVSKIMRLWYYQIWVEITVGFESVSVSTIKTIFALL